jgi:ubiquinone/menaquinone biosynthesis C-methylase UbiE
VSDRDPAAGERSRVAQIYQRYAASSRKQLSWSADNPGNVAIRAELVEAVFALAGAELRSAGNVLDVGSGSGWWLERLAADDRVPASLHGLELLAERQLAARARVPAATVALGDARALPYETGTFEVVTIFTVLSSLASATDVLVAIDEARRVLTPGGLLVIWEPRVRNPLNPRTLLVSRALLAEALAGMRTQTVTTTVVPALARQLGDRTDGLYPALARLRALRTHRLVSAHGVPHNASPR